MNFTSLLFLKPILTTLVVPPAGPLILVFIGLFLFYKSRKVLKKLSFSLILTGSLCLWVMSCKDTALWLYEAFLPQYAPATLAQLKEAQVILVLGGGAENFDPAYVGPELSSAAYDRLRYGVYLSKLTGLPLAYSGGKGWGESKNSVPEADIARATLKRDWSIELKYSENRSRDTRENADLSYTVLAPKGITHVVLVTHSKHMPRSVRNFRQAGFDIVPAPMGFLTPSASPILDALPSEGGLQNSRLILKELIGLLLT